MKRQIIGIALVLLSSCKTVQSENLRKRGVDLGGAGNNKTDLSDKQDQSGGEQTISVEELENLPELQVGTNEKTGSEKITTLQIECSLPLTTLCFGLIPNQDTATPADTKVGEALEKYARKVSAEQHRCAYYERNLSQFDQIHFLSDAVVYWTRTETGISYRTRSIALTFASGCYLDETAPNPYESLFAQKSVWDGQATLKSLGFQQVTIVPLTPEFEQALAKAGKLTQQEHECSWATRPLIYAFPDGVVYRIPSSTTVNVFSYPKVKSMACKLPEALEKKALELQVQCLQNAKAFLVAPVDAPPPVTLKSLNALPLTFRQQLLDQELYANISQNGKRVEKEAFQCTFVSRTHNFQFADGAAFIDELCGTINIYSNEYLKLQNCVIPPL